MVATGLRARFDAATDPDFQKRVAQALVEEAVTVYNETPPPNHAARAAYAVLVATTPPLSMVTPNAQGVLAPDVRVYALARLLTALGVDESSSDAAIATGVASAWNALAGA